jgi:4-hydroxy-4-methyl-2-oxoglutarate aldolase
MDGSTTLVERLKNLSSSVISDVLDICGYPNQSLSSDIRPLDRKMRLAGAAICCAGHSEEQHQGVDATPPAAAISNYEIDRCIAPGGIVVIATNGHSTSAVVGGLMCLAFSRRSCGGLVTDSGVRDISEILELQLPTFCRYATPLNSARRWKLTGMGSTIRMAGQASAEVEIRPGDLVMGDADGVMIIPLSIAADVIAWGERLAAIEATIVAQLEAGEPREAVFSANPRFAHIGRLKPPES